MAIKVIEQPDVHVSEGELRRYQYQYKNFCRGYCGIPPSLEEFIRAQKRLK